MTQRTGTIQQLVFNNSKTNQETQQPFGEMLWNKTHFNTFCSKCQKRNCSENTCTFHRKNLQAMYQSTICDSFTMSKKNPKIHPVWKKKSLMNVVAQIHFNFIVQKKYWFTDAKCIYLTLQPLRLNCEFSPLAATQFLIN